MTDAACASAMAAMSAAIEGLVEGHFDAVVSGHDVMRGKPAPSSRRNSILAALEAGE